MMIILWVVIIMGSKCLQVLCHLRTMQMIQFLCLHLVIDTVYALIKLVITLTGMGMTSRWMKPVYSKRPRFQECAMERKMWSYQNSWILLWLLITSSSSASKVVAGETHISHKQGLKELGNKEMLWCTKNWMSCICRKFLHPRIQTH